MLVSPNQTLTLDQPKKSSPTNKTLHKCTFEDCEKTFRDLRSFKEHIMVHKGEKPYTCYLPSCAKLFTRIASLQKHERIHRGQKPYSCPDCGQTFTQGCNLKRHMRTHSGFKPFVCESCKKNFITHANLKQHMIIHQKKDDRQKYSCKQCERSYFYKNSMRKHMEDAHNYRETKTSASTDDSKTIETEDDTLHLQQESRVTYEDKSVNTNEDEMLRLLRYISPRTLETALSVKHEERVNPNDVHTFLHINLQYHIHIIHGDHIDFLYQSNLYNLRPNGHETHLLEISEQNPVVCKPVLELSHFSDFEALDKLYREFLSRHSGTISRETLQSTQICNALNCFCSSKCASKKPIEKSSTQDFNPATGEKSCCQKKSPENKYLSSKDTSSRDKEDCCSMKKFSDKKCSGGSKQGFTKYQKEDKKNGCCEASQKESVKEGCCRSLLGGEECICHETIELKHVHSDSCGHIPIRHGDHIDYIVESRLHHLHGSHCDDHGEVGIVVHSNPTEPKLDLIDYSTYYN